jgi:thiazole synthase
MSVQGSSPYSPLQDSFELAGVRLKSRILLGTSRYPSPQHLLAAAEAAETEVLTVSIRRVNLQQQQETFLGLLPEGKYRLLPNTAGCFTSKDAIFTAELARELLGTNWIKVEVIGDERTLLPDPIELLEACEALVKCGFVVLPYCSDDPMLCKRLADVGCAAVMPLAAPIGSGLGIRNPHNLELIRNSIQLPVIVDAGIGTASDATLAMELGCDAILLNTAVAEAQDPISMALAMKFGVWAGRAARLAGRIPKIHTHAQASSPMFDLPKNA